MALPQHPPPRKGWEGGRKGKEEKGHLTGTMPIPLLLAMAPLAPQLAALSYYTHAPATPVAHTTLPHRARPFSSVGRASQTSCAIALPSLGGRASVTEKDKRRAGEPLAHHPTTPPAPHYLHCRCHTPHARNTPLLHMPAPTLPDCAAPPTAPPLRLQHAHPLRPPGQAARTLPACCLHCLDDITLPGRTLPMLSASGRFAATNNIARRVNGAPKRCIFTAAQTLLTPPAT